MRVLIGVGIITSVSIFYLGRKGWHAVHKAVGITPGVLRYQDGNAPLSLSNISWQQLDLNKKHLNTLADSQLRQLQRIDEKVASYYHYELERKSHKKTPALSGAQFVLHKMLQTRLPELLSSYYQLTIIKSNTKSVNNQSRDEAGKLLQEVLDSIEQRLNSLSEQLEQQQLQGMQVMKRYMDSHNR